MGKKKSRRKRKPYKRRFHKPLIELGELKTTSKEGYNQYMKEYMRKWRQLKK